MKNFRFRDDPASCPVSHGWWSRTLLLGLMLGLPIAATAMALPPQRVPAMAPVAVASGDVDNDLIEWLAASMGDDALDTMPVNWLEPRAGTIGSRPGDLDVRFRGGALDGGGRSSVLPWLGSGGGATVSPELLTLGVAIEPPRIITAGQTINFGNRVYTVSLRDYPSANGGSTRLLFNRFLPDGRLDTSFGNIGGSDRPGYQYEDFFQPAQGGGRHRAVPVKVLPVFQSADAGSGQVQYQRFYVLYNYERSTTVRGYGLLCYRVSPDQSAIEVCPAGLGLAWEWPMDFFQNDRMWVRDLAWMPSDGPAHPGHVMVAGNVRNNPANAQDLDFYVAAHRADTYQREGFSPNDGYAVIPIQGDSRDMLHAIAVHDWRITLVGSSFHSSQLRGAAVQLFRVGALFGLSASYCPANASVAQCGPTAVRHGKRVFEVGSGQDNATVRAIAKTGNRIAYVQTPVSGQLRVIETDLDGNRQCTSGPPLNIVLCRDGNFSGYGPMAVDYDGNGGLMLFGYDRPEGGINSAVQIRRLLTAVSTGSFVAQSNHSSNGALHLIDWPTFDSSAPTTQAGYVARDSRGRYLVTSASRWESVTQSVRRVGTFRLTGDVIFDNGLERRE